MDEKTHAEVVLGQQISAEANQAAPPPSTDVTAAFDPSTIPEDTAAGLGPADEAVRPATILDKSLSFLQSGGQPGSLGRLGHYVVLELLGKGAFGIVLKGMDEKLQRLVAIKVLAPQLARSPTARSRFLREARAAAAVNSKYVVSTYEVNEQPLPYLVMEYVPGKTLQARLDQSGSIETRDVLRIGAEIAEGLAAAHKQGLIHRDIKPANILLEDGRVKIADFGLARAADDASLTQSGAIAGTPLFMSPEQARGETLDPRSDLFSLGSVLYMMCTGHAPFRAPKTLGVLKRVCDDTPRPIRDSNSNIPDALAAIVNMLLVKDRAGRFQTAAAVADLLRQHLAHLDDPTLPSPSGVYAGAETADYLPVVAARLKGPSSQQMARSGWKWAAAAAVVLLPLFVLTLTETAGITHWFRGSRALTEPNQPGGAPTPPTANPETPPLLVAPEGSAEGNPLKKSKIGDWADYKMVRVVNGVNIDGKIRMEVAARTEDTAKLRTIVTMFGRTVASSDQEIDLTKPYDPSNAVTFFMGTDARIQKGESDAEKIKVGAKEYETSWETMNVAAKVNGRDLEANLKCWTSRSAPLGGLVKIEAVSVLKTEANGTESKMTMELTGSGSKAELIEARSCADRAIWSAAAAAYARYFAMQPLEDGEVGFEYAAVLLLSGDQAGYRKICAEMLDHSGQLAIRPYHVARTWTLTSGPVTGAALAGQRADDELKRSNWEFWSLTEQGALAYRAGRYDEAATLLEQSLNADGRSGRAVLNWLWLALVEDRRGNNTEAGTWLAKATEWLDQYPSISGAQDDATGMHLHNWAEAQILHREAARALALTRRFPAVLRGEDKPKDNAERLAFARVAHAQKKFTVAARLWTVALDSDPTLGDDCQMQCRYCAARAAARATAGQDKDEPPLDDAAKAALRRQALDWLTAEQTAWRKLLETAPTETRPAIAQTLRYWRQDSDLAGVRDAEALAKLPVDVRAAYAQLWADVADLLKKAEEQPK